EAWAYKVRDNELGNPFYSTALLYSRDVFSFWAPLDTQFLEAAVNWSYFQNADYMSAFWSQYLRAYIDYDSSTQNASPSTLFGLARAAAGAAISIPAVSSTGTSWNGLIMNPVDTTAPVAPVVLSTEYPNQIVLNWLSSDNVGVYKYTVARPGVATVTTIETAFTEASLLDGTCYVYTVTSLDFAGNEAATTPPPVCTPDITAPTAPTATAVTAGAVVQGPPVSSSMGITWSGATDNTGPSGIAGYVIYRSVGSNSGPFAYVGQTPASPLSYTNPGLLKSATLYCYQIKTIDLVQRMSPAGPTACATTGDWQAPTVPTGLAATTGGAPVVNLTWKASTNGLAAALYDVQRRQGTSGSFIVVKTGIQSTSYTDGAAPQLDDTIAPTVSVAKPSSGSTISKTVTFQASAYDRGLATTYTWQVRATDATLNKSAWGSPATITYPVVGGVLSSVVFSVDGSEVGTVTAAPYYIRWDSKSVSNGSHTFTVEAKDTAGNTTSATVQAIVSNTGSTPPLLSD
ncbi:MAG: Ig-like domain-containing protein, partial [Bryobacteraceae bacterium]